MRRISGFTMLAMLVAGSTMAAQQAAQQPVILHAQVSSVTGERDLARQIGQLGQSGRPMWVGYQIAVADGFRTGADDSKVTLLEGEHEYGRRGLPADAGFDHANVLMRVDHGGVERMRLETPDRQLDAGGLGFVWINGVGAGESVRMLKSLAMKTGSDKVRNDAVFFISQHASGEANTALIELAASGDELGLREKAAFWLANQRGHEGFLAIQHLARTDTNAAFREKLTFDLTLSKEADAVDELIRMAEKDESAQVRRQAQFWMANIGGKRVKDTLRAATEHDPDEEVRKSAVFALSRLPGDEATAQLIQVAKTSADASVRKQAVFWLGQSSDPKALDYLTQLLHE